jgi:hypothetical protein
MDQAGQGETEGLEGKAAVKALLLERLEEAGFLKPRRLGAEAFEKGKAYMAERLAYMTADNLMVLADALVDTAQGSDWPSEIVVMQLARGIQAPPAATSRALSSWLASVEGPKAVAGGYLVDLYRFIRGKLRPPMPFEMNLVMGRAVENARHRMMVDDRVRRNAASDEDRAWLVSWLGDEREALALVDAGNAKRAANGFEQKAGEA